MEEEGSVEVVLTGVRHLGLLDENLLVFVVV